MRLFEAGCLLTFSTFTMSAYTRLGAQSNKYGISIQCSLPEVLRIREIANHYTGLGQTHFSAETKTYFYQKITSRIIF